MAKPLARFIRRGVGARSLFLSLNLGLPLAFGAGRENSTLLGIFFHQMAKAAILAFLRQGFVPYRILAFRIPAAGIERLASFGLPLDQLAGATRLGAGHPGRDGLDRFALGVIGTG